MITVGAPDVDPIWFLLPGLVGLLIFIVVALLGPLVVRQARHQAREDAAVDRWRTHDGSD